MAFAHTHSRQKRLPDLQSRQGAASSTHPRSGKTTHNADGDIITADYLFFERHTDNVGIGDNVNGLVILDVATRYLDC